MRRHDIPVTRGIYCQGNQSASVKETDIGQAIHQHVKQKVTFSISVSISVSPFVNKMSVISFRTLYIIPYCRRFRQSVMYNMEQTDVS